MGPGIVGLAATQLNVFVNTIVATGEGTGAVSWLTYAFRVMYLPIGLFGVSIATATTPAMSRLAAANDLPRMRSTLASAIALMLTLNVPATLGLMVLATPIVRLLFERGRFTPADTLATAAAVQLYALGLVGYSVVKIVSPTFYALGRSRTPAAVGVAAVLLNAALSVSTRAVLRLQGPGAQRVGRLALQRRHARVAGARRARRPRVPARGRDLHEDARRGRRHGRRGLGRDGRPGIGAARVVARGPDHPPGGGHRPGGARRSASARSSCASASSKTCAMPSRRGCAGSSAGA